MTRRDAALLSLTLAGMYCLFTALTLWSETMKQLASETPRADRLLAMMPMLLLTCSGTALIQSRRKLSTWIFNANPSLDSTAVVDAGDMRLLTVRIVGLLLLADFARSLQTFTVDHITPIILGTAVALCFFATRPIVRVLFAAGPGEGKSARYRENFAFALGVIGAFYVARFSGAAVEGVMKRTWMESSAAFAMLAVGIALLLGRRTGSEA
ncbi:MAG TPA: hypothetical protein VJ032_04410 [Thermoanaerobaculia bacterium]|nr:hypothetical protein [Thermoanaerobaculia bacterium]